MVILGQKMSLLGYPLPTQRSLNLESPTYPLEQVHKIPESCRWSNTNPADRGKVGNSLKCIQKSTKIAHPYSQYSVSEPPSKVSLRLPSVLALIYFPMIKALPQLQVQIMFVDFEVFYV